VMVVGAALDWRGFSGDESDTSTSADVTWSVFAVSGILAFFIGIAAWVHGRRAHRLGDIRAGEIAMGAFLLAIGVAAIWSAFD